MNVLLRKITITSDEYIQLLNKTTKKVFFGLLTKETETITFEKKKYEYWIEFHIDQGRFYYGETKPVEVRNGVYEYTTNTIHTKRGLDKSLSIINEIRNRTDIIHPDYDIKLYQYPNITMFRQFDKDSSKE